MRVGAVFESHGRELGGGRVVDHDPAAERARLCRREQALEVALAELPGEPAGHEDRLALVGNSARHELVEHGGERLPSRVDLRAR